MKKLAIVLLSLVLVPGASPPIPPGEKGREGEFLRQHHGGGADHGGVYRLHGRKGRIYVRISTAKYVATVLTEHDAGKLQADVLQGPLPILETLKEKGVLAALQVALRRRLSRMGDARTTPSSSSASSTSP